MPLSSPWKNRIFGQNVSFRANLEWRHDLALTMFKLVSDLCLSFARPRKNQAPKRPCLPKSMHFWLFWDKFRACRLIWRPVGWLVGGWLWRAGKLFQVSIVLQWFSHISLMRRDTKVQFI